MAGKAKKYYCVDQEQNGLWYQVGHFAFKKSAVDFAHGVADRSKRRTRVKLTYPGKDCPVK